jgi:cytochrome b pre-mRNA-processing protein 3
MPWLRPHPARQTAEQLYAALVVQARRPEFYRELGVPDTLDGRFELVALHTFFALRRLKSDASAAETRQALVDIFVDDMDASLREMGAGDLGVGRRVKAMAQALYGRIAAYEAGLSHSEQALIDALRRNLYGTVTKTAPDPLTLEKLAAYVRRESAAPSLNGDAVGFGPPPGPATETGQKQRR